MVILTVIQIDIIMIMNVNHMKVVVHYQQFQSLQKMIKTIILVGGLNLEIIQIIVIRFVLLVVRTITFLIFGMLPISGHFLVQIL